MLGYTQPNNDVYVFFEAEELERLEDETVRGTYFNINNPSNSALLEAVVEDDVRSFVETNGTRNEDGLFTGFKVVLGRRPYWELKENGLWGVHQGYRHVILTHARNLRFEDQVNYAQLKHWELKFSPSFPN